MKIISLSYFISNNSPVYGGNIDAIKINQLKSIKEGDTSNELKINIHNHISTHIDFPHHFDQKGKTLNDYDTEYWVIDNVSLIESSFENIEEQLDLIKPDVEFLIVKTNFSKFRGDEKYWKEQPVIKSYLADILRNKFTSLKIIGFDMISLTSKLDRNEGKKSHINFLINNDILIIEDMNLNQLNKCPEKVIISPLLIDKADGVPCNIIAFIKE